MDDQTDSNPFISVYTPIALVALALAALFFGQIKGASQAKESMAWQSTNADKQITALRENTLKYEDAITKQKVSVTTSEQTQKQFSDFMKDLNDLATGSDKEAAKDAQTIMAIARQNGINYAGNPEAPKKDEAPKKKDEK